MTAAAQGRFPTYRLVQSSSTEKASQSMAPSFGTNPWKADLIWGNSTNKSVIGSAYTSQRDKPGSRGSDEPSPTAPSGSAQLSHQSEAETPTWATRNGIWNTQDHSAQGRTTSGTTSPSQTREGTLSQHGNVSESQFYGARSGLGQNGNAFSSRTKSHGTLDKFPQTFSGMMAEDLDNGVPYSSMASKYSYDSNAFYKRGSQVQEAGFSSVGQMRDAGSVPSSRANDFSVQTTPGSLNPDLSPFESMLPNGSRGSVSRPSVPHQSLSYPANGVSARGLPPVNAAIDRELSGLVGSSLRMTDTLNHDESGLSSNAYLNPQSQPFQFNPASQTWGGEVPTNARGFGQGYSQQDTFADQVASSYIESKRGSVAERGSPSSGSFHRPSLNSPRYTPGPSSRADSWGAGSRPISRNHALAQEFDQHRAASHFSQNPAYYANGNFYGSGFNGSQFPPPPNPYEVYGQGQGFRNQMQVPSYGVNNAYMPPVIPVRPSRDQDPGKGVRSVLLEEFRASNRSNKRFELKDIYGHVVEFSGDQHGSRFIQEKLQSANSDEKDQVFQEIQRNALQLMKDVFGNYVIQKFFEHGSQVQKTILARQMKGKVAELSTQMYACRVVQKALEHVLIEQQEEIVEELKPDIMRIVKDSNGNHVIQKIISLVPRICVPFMMAAFRGQIHNLAAHNFGCRVVQRMLEFGTEDERRELMVEVHSCAPQLITDQFGNYVAQHIIGHGSSEDRIRMIRLVTDQLIEYSMHKFASNVVEKCVEEGTSEDRKLVTTKFISRDAKGNHPLDRVMIDQYGNYVLQKAVEQLEGQDKIDLLREMKQRHDILRKTVNGRQMSAIERLLAASEGVIQQSKPAATSSQPASSTNAALQIDINSVAPTPALTTGNGSPESSSPPSTNLGDHPTDEDKSGSLSNDVQVVEDDEHVR